MTGRFTVTFGIRLRRHRLARGWTFRQAAQASGVGYMTIKRAETGIPIRVFDAAKLADAYQTTLDALLNGEPPE